MSDEPVSSVGGLSVSFAQGTHGGRSSTWSSLLERAKANDEEAWATLVKLYAPLVYRECRTMGVAPQDAPDVVQEVFRKVAANLAGFRHDRPGDSFRAWLATIARNGIRDFFKLHAGRPAAVGGSEMHRLVQGLPDLDAAESTITARPDTITGVVRQAIAQIRGEFEPHTWEAFWKTTIESVAPADVAKRTRGLQMGRLPSQIPRPPPVAKGAGGTGVRSAPLPLGWGRGRGWG